MSVNIGTLIRLGEEFQVADRRRWQSAMTSPIGDVGSERVNHGERIDPINFGGQKSKVKVTMDIYGNKLVNTIESKPLCAS